MQKTFDQHVRPSTLISENCRKPEKVTKVVVSYGNRNSSTYYATKVTKKQGDYALVLINGETVEVNGQFVVSKTPMQLITIVCDITEWINYHDNKCRTSIETRKFAIGMTDNAVLVERYADKINPISDAVVQDGVHKPFSLMRD